MIFKIFDVYFRDVPFVLLLLVVTLWGRNISNRMIKLQRPYPFYPPSYVLELLVTLDRWIRRHLCFLDLFGGRFMGQWTRSLISQIISVWILRLQ